MANAKTRAAKAVGRTAAIATLTTAILGGTVGVGIASADEGNGYHVLHAETGTPTRMHFFTDAPNGVTSPNSRVKVGVTWDLWNIWNAFPAKDTPRGRMNFLQDIVKLGAWQTSTIKLDGQECGKYDAVNGTVPIEGGQHDGLNIEPVDFLGLVAQVRNLLATVVDGIIPDNAFSKIIESSVGASCEFRVPSRTAANINVEGEVNLRNFFGLARSYQTGHAFLPVKSPEAPTKPSIESDYNVAVHQGGSVKGKGKPGTVISWNIGGRAYKTPTAIVGDDGWWELKLPAGVDPSDASRPAYVTAAYPGSDVESKSDVHNLTVIPDLARPEISDPKTDTVDPGQVLTVTGSEGSTVVPVGENGEPVGGSAVVKNGKAQVTLNKDLKPGSKVRIRATDQITPASAALYSDSKTVKGDTPPEAKPVYQTQVPAATAGKTSNLTFAIQPKGGDLLQLAGKTVTIKAPDDFTFAMTGNGSWNVTASAGDKDDKNNGKWEWLGGNAKVSEDRRTMTLTLPGADRIKELTAGSLSIKIGVTVGVAAGKTAAAGQKAGGQVAVEGVGTTDLKGKVS